MKKIYLLSLVTMLLTACQTPKNDEQKINTTSTTNHNIKPCTKIYMPVCAKVSVQCVTTPCPSVEQTFSNLCMMQNNKNATLLHKGACE